MDAITLLEPLDSSVTEPLQEHALPLMADVDGEAGGAFAWNNLQVVSADRSMPKPVVLKWEKLACGWRGPTYTVILSTDRNFTSDVRVFENVTRPSLDVLHLFIGTRYYWKVSACKRKTVIGESPVWSFTTNSLPPRWIQVPGTTNVRDVGGWSLPDGKRIRQGVIYRGSEINGHLQLLPRGVKVLEDELGIRTDLDLRGDYDGACPALDPERVTWIHAPISPYDCISDFAFREGYRRIFQTFADPASYPIYFHCVGGADRGGTVAFILNALLGKRREDLFHDYELTTLSVWGVRSSMSEQFRSLVDTLATYGDDPDDLANQAEQYLKFIGITDDEIRAIRTALVLDQ